MFNMNEPVSTMTIVITIVMILAVSLLGVYAVKKAKKDNV